MYRYGCIYRIHVCVNVCVCVCVRARGGVCYGRLYNIDARASRHVRMPRCAHAHAHRRLHLRLAAAISSRMRVWMDVYACVYRWLGIDGRASVCMYMCIYRTISISLLYIYYACMYGHIAALCTQVPMSLCTQPDRYRWVHVYLAPSVQLNI
jgi:hypothetical protein